MLLLLKSCNTRWSPSSRTHPNSTSLHSRTYRPFAHRPLYFPTSDSRVRCPRFSSLQFSQANSSHHRNLKYALNLANVVADSRYKLYDDFTVSHGRRLGDYLSVVRQAILGGLEGGGSDPFRVLSVWYLCTVLLFTVVGLYLLVGNITSGRSQSSETSEGSSRLGRSDDLVFYLNWNKPDSTYLPTGLRGVFHLWDSFWCFPVLSRWVTSKFPPFYQLICWSWKYPDHLQWNVQQRPIQVNASQSFLVPRPPRKCCNLVAVSLAG